MAKSFDKDSEDIAFSRVLTRNSERIAEWLELNWSEERILQSLGGAVRRSELRHFIEISAYLEQQSSAPRNSETHKRK